MLEEADGETHKDAQPIRDSTCGQEDLSSNYQWLSEPSSLQIIGVHRVATA